MADSKLIGKSEACCRAIGKVKWGAMTMFSITRTLKTKTCKLNRNKRQKCEKFWSYLMHCPFDVSNL